MGTNMGTVRPYRLGMTTSRSHACARGKNEVTSVELLFWKDND